MSDEPKAPAGWYDDPDRPGTQRWWNGEKWSERFRPAPGSSPDVTFSAAPKGGGGETPQSVPKGVKIAAAIVALLVVIGLLGGGDDDPPNKVAAPVESSEPESKPEPGPSKQEVLAARKKQAAKVVAAYYASLDDGDFSRAWRRLSAGVRSEFDGFDSWRDGYSTTLSSDASGIRVVSLDGNTATVKVRLRSTDLDACGDRVRQRFSGKWQLRRAGKRWVATDISMRKVGGKKPVDDPADCYEEPDELESESSSGDCDPNYEGACIPVGVGDIDCPEAPGSNFRVVGSDPHRFDADGDGVACEG